MDRRTNTRKIDDRQTTDRQQTWNFLLKFLSPRSPNRAEKNCFSSIRRKITLETVAIYILRDSRHIKIVVNSWAFELHIPIHGTHPYRRLCPYPECWGNRRGADPLWLTHTHTHAHTHTHTFQGCTPGRQRLTNPMFHDICVTGGFPVTKYVT